MDQNKNEEILNRLTDIFYFIQYGKLMPGFIHNINGKLTSLDSKIQLAYMKMQMKLKKLSNNQLNYSEEAKVVLEKEYSDLIAMFDILNTSKNELNSLLSVLNCKASNENVHVVTMIDINSAIKDFHDFFNFYKRYKHNITAEFELEGSPFVKMKYNDLYFLLYSVVRNAVDATHDRHNKKNIIRFTTKNFDDSVELTIFNNGDPIPQNTDIFAPLSSDKARFGNDDVSEEMPKGAGLDLFFLKRMLDKYSNLKYNWSSSEAGTEFKFVIPKK